MTPRPFLGCCLLGSCCLLGCGEPLRYPEDIDRPRIVSARGYVEDEPGRFTPVSADPYVIDWTLAGTKGPLSAYGIESVCLAQPTPRGIPECLEKPFVEEESGESTDHPSFSFQVPQLEDESLMLLAQAAFCTDAVPRVRAWPDRIGCNNGEEPLLGMLTIELAPVNHHPNLALAEFTFDGEAWTSADADDLPPPVEADRGVHRIEIELDPDSREMVDETYELLRLDYATNLGQLDGSVGFVETDSSELRVIVDWTAPSELGSAKTAHFYFVLRDGRGGVDTLHLQRSVVP